MSSATANTVALSAGDGGATDVGSKRVSAKAGSRAGAAEAHPNTKAQHMIRTDLQAIGGHQCNACATSCDRGLALLNRSITLADGISPSFSV